MARQNDQPLPKPIVVDTDVIVTALDGGDVRHAEARECMDRLRSGYQIILPCSVMVELPCVLSRMDPRPNFCPDEDMAMRWLEYYLQGPETKALDLSIDSAYRASFLGTKLKLRGMDAIVAFFAFDQNCPILTYNEKDFRRIEKNSTKIGPKRDMMNGMDVAHGPSLGFEYENHFIRVLVPKDILSGQY